MMWGEAVRSLTPRHYRRWRQNLVLITIAKHELSRRRGSFAGSIPFRTAFDLRVRDAVAETEVLFAVGRSIARLCPDHVDRGRKSFSLFVAHLVEVGSVLCLKNQHGVDRSAVGSLFVDLPV